MILVEMGKARSAVVTMPFIPKSSFIGTILMVANSFNIINETSLKHSKALFLVDPLFQWAISGLFFNFVFSTENSKHVHHIIWPITRFEQPRTSGIGIRKRPLCQLSHIHCPTVSFFRVNTNR